MNDNIYTPDEARQFVEAANKLYDTAQQQLNPAKVKATASWLRAHKLHFVVAEATKNKIEDANGKVYEYPAVGKKTQTKGWPDLALKDAIAVDDIPPTANIGVQTGTPVERDGVTYTFAELDFDVIRFIPIWQKVVKYCGLPNTIRWGREGKRDSHCGWLIDRAIPSVAQDVEIRCQSSNGEYAPYGKQTICWGSVWAKDGKVEDITLEDDSADDFATIKTDDLLFAYDLMYAVDALAPVFPEHPRHSLYPAILYTAARRGMPKERALAVCLTLNDCSVNPERNKSLFHQWTNTAYDDIANNRHNKQWVDKQGKTHEPVHYLGIPFLLAKIANGDKEIEKKVNYFLTVLGLADTKTKDAAQSDPNVFTLKDHRKVDVAKTFQQLLTKNLRTMVVPPIEYLCDPYIPMYSVTAICGEAGSGKSTWLHRALHVAANKNKKLRVIYADRDNAISFVKPRSETLSVGLEDRISYWSGGNLDESGKIDEPWDIEEAAWMGLIEQIKAAGEEPVLVFDTLNSFLNGQNENDNSVVGALLTFTRKMAHAGATVIIVHHTGKSATSKEARGASVFKGSVDALWVVDSDFEEDRPSMIKEMRLTPKKSRLGDGVVFRYSMVDGVPTLKDQEPSDEDLLEFIEQNEGKSKEQIIAASKGKFRRQTLRDAFDKFLVGKKLKLVKMKVYMYGTEVQGDKKPTKSKLAMIKQEISQ